MSTPQHIAILCDGNRRWAKQNNKSEFSGHKYAIDFTIENLTNEAIKLNIPYLTFWVLSTENWKRGKEWMKKYFKLMHYFFDKKLDIIIKKGAKLKTIGDLNKLPKDIQKLIKNTVEKSKNNKKITIVIAINYGGQDEILRAIKKISFPGRLPSRDGNLKIKNLTKKDFEKYLDTANIPNPDLLIRTGKNNTRLSGFMLWQAAYAQLYFTNTLFPDFKAKQLNDAISWYQTQTKNLGK